MKVGLPLAALAILSAVLFYSGLFDNPDQLAVTFAEVETLNDDLRMVSPRISGLDARGRPYIVTADTATQIGDDQNHISLDNIHAILGRGEGSDAGGTGETEEIIMTAVTGKLQADKQILELFEKIDMTSTQGYVFHATSAQINFATGSMVSTEPVNGEGPFGTLEAQSMEAHNNGELIQFTGGVRMLIKLAPDAPSQ